MEYKEMYAEMVKATEKALDILINAQRKCEELFIDAAERGGEQNPSSHDNIPSPDGPETLSS